VLIIDLDVVHFQIRLFAVGAGVTGGMINGVPVLFL